MKTNRERSEKTTKEPVAGLAAGCRCWPTAGAVTGLLIVLLVAAAPRALSGQSCSPGWNSGFGDPGATLESFAVEAYALHNGKLVATGTFGEIGSFGLGTVTDGVACWNGVVWDRMDGGFNRDPLDGRIEALALYGGVLYGAGPITLLPPPCTIDPCGIPKKEQYALVRFNGSCPGGSWSVAGPKATAARVGQMAVHDGLLYLAGHLSISQAAFPSQHAVSFNGSSYGALGGGLAGRSLGPADSSGAYGVVAVTTAEAAASDLDEGIYMVGSFSHAWNIDPVTGDFVPAAGTDGIARWDGTTWSSVGGGLVQPVCDPGEVCDPAALFAIEKYDDGTGLALYVGGRFNEIGPGVAVNNVARWDGFGWSPVQGPTDPGDGVEIGYAASMTVHKRSLLVGGQFNFAGGEAAQNVACWNETGWSPLNGGIGELSVDVKALASYDDGFGAGPLFFAGGHFQSVVNNPPIELTAVNIARWEGAHCLGDIHLDGVVDTVDLRLLLVAWGPCSGCPEDLTGDGQVDGADLNALLAAWGRCPCC